MQNHSILARAKAGEPDVPCISIGIIAWNEESGIEGTLRSLFRQSLFGELDGLGLRCEVVCVVNGSTDQTAAITERFFQAQRRDHPHRGAFTARVAELVRRGKGNAWNCFVHSFSEPKAGVLFLMDADICIHRPDTMWNLLMTLEKDPRP